MFVTHQFIIYTIPFKAICDSGEIGTKYIRALGSGEMVVLGRGKGFIFALKSRGWKVLLKIKIFKHAFGV